MDKQTNEPPTDRENELFSLWEQAYDRSCDWARQCGAARGALTVANERIKSLTADLAAARRQLDAANAALARGKQREARLLARLEDLVRRDVYSRDGGWPGVVDALRLAEDMLEVSK